MDKGAVRNSKPENFLLELQEEMPGQLPDNPTIVLQNNSVTVTTHPFLLDKIELALFALTFVVSFFAWPLLISSLLLLPIGLIYFYSQFIGVGTLEIDFLMKTISIKNKFVLINWRRQILKVKSEFSFSEIIEIGQKHGPFLDRLGRGIKRRSLLYFETEKDWEIYACQFKNEEDAESFVITLQKFLRNKEKIIA